jgi:TRAP-type mannitol/chloroaromatic compound transport system permease small subunit
LCEYVPFLIEPNVCTHAEAASRYVHLLSHFFSCILFFLICYTYIDMRIELSILNYARKNNWINMIIWCFFLISFMWFHLRITFSAIGKASGRPPNQGEESDKNHETIIWIKYFDTLVKKCSVTVLDMFSIGMPIVEWYTTCKW